MLEVGHAQTCQQRKQITSISIAIQQKTYLLTAVTGCAATLFDGICCFKVRLFASNGEEINIPSLNCSERECLNDFSEREEMRIKYPGESSM